MSWLFFYLVCLCLYTDIFWKWLWLNQSTITVIHLGMGNQANGMASLWYCDSLHICTLLVLQFRRIPEATNSKCLDRRWLWRRLVTVLHSITLLMTCYTSQLTSYTRRTERSSPSGKNIRYYKYTLAFVPCWTMLQNALLGTLSY